MNNWIAIKNRRPDNEQQVLTHYYDAPLGIHEYSVLTYFEKGTPITDEIPPEGETDTEILMGLIFQEPNRKTEADGFYIYDVGGHGYCRWSKHADYITHWMPLTPPAGEE